jgi:hypothetical protein
MKGYFIPTAQVIYNVLMRKKQEMVFEIEKVTVPMLYECPKNENTRLKCLEWCKEDAEASQTELIKPTKNCLLML